MNRKEAIRTISINILDKLKKEERENHILNYWCIDEEDLEYRALSKKLKYEMDSYLEPQDDVCDSKYDELIFLSLKNEFIGVKNEYLSSIISKIKKKDIIVIGKVEELYPCPCCGYKTLSEQGEYDICNICYWEDDGTRELDKYSFVNKMSLLEAKKVTLKNNSEKDNKYYR